MKGFERIIVANRIRMTFMRLLIHILATLLLCSCVGRSSDATDSLSVNAEVSDSIEKADLSVQASLVADSLLATMTIYEKVAQMLMPALFSQDDPYTMKVVGEYGKKGIGGVVLLKGNSASVKAISDSINRTSRFFPFISIDAEWGLGMRLIDEPVYPFNSEIGEEVTEDDMFRYGETVGEQCRKIGINMVLGPVVDVARRGSVMGRRSYGDDPQRVADYAVAYSKGLESKGVMSVAKHFPGHGSARGDSHKGTAVIDRSLHQMDSVDLYPFRQYISAGLSGIMVGHLAVPAVDPEMRPAAVSPTVISELLKKDLEFQGLIFTDALTMGGAAGAGADKAIEAGADIVLAPINTDKEIEHILKAVEDGKISEERLDSSVRKILLYKVLMQMKR